MSGEKLCPLAAVLCHLSDNDRGKAEDARTVEGDGRERHHQAKPHGEMISFLNFDFEAVKQAEGQGSEVLADVAN
jgi:hypothetical protein